MATMIHERESEWRAGARDVLPLAAGVAMYGLAFGLLAVQAGLTPPDVSIMGITVFGGASQIIAVERLGANAGAGAAIAAGLALNLRLVLVTASIREIYADRPFWQVAWGAHMATDENWALLLARRARGLEAGYGYLVASGLVLMATWLVSTVAGAVLAGGIPDPETFGADFAFTAAFIAIAFSLYRGRTDIAPWAVAAAVAGTTSLSGVVDPSWAIVAGGLAGAVCAAFTTRDTALPDADPAQ